jgi:hypothetical protein
MKRFAFVIALLAIAGVVFAQDAPVAEKSEADAPAGAAVVKEAAPAAPAAEGDFCARERMVDGKPTLMKCHKKGCKFFPKKDVKCFASAEAAKAAGVTSFCKICCKDQQ